MSAPVERIRPHADPTAERQWIACALANPRTLAEHPVPVGDLYVPSHAYVVGALEALRQRGAPIDTATLRLELQTRGELGRVGDDLILGLTDSIVPLSAAGELAATIRRHALIRRTIAAQRRALELAERGEIDACLAANLEAANHALRSSPDRKRLSAREQAMQLGTLGEAMPTMLGTLDLSTRGGLRGGKFVVLGGAPGAGKTTLAVQLGRHYHGRGHAVLIIAADESADGLLIRWGQQAGAIREQLERPGYEDAKQQLADDLTERVVIVDQDDAATLEGELASFANIAAATEMPGVVIVDSLQRVRTIAGSQAESERARIDAGVAACKAAARRHGMLVIATSEMARGFYRGGSQDPTEALGSFKESGGIEYGVDVALALTSVKGKPDLVHVEIAKNRLGPRATFALELDRDRARFAETFMASDDDDAGEDEATAKKREAAQQSKVEAAGERLVQELLKLSVKGIEITGQRELRALIQGRNDFRANVVSHLIVSGRIEGGRGKPWRVRQADEVPDA